MVSGYLRVQDTVTKMHLKFDGTFSRGDFASEVKTFVERFEAAIDGRTEDFTSSGTPCSRLGSIWTADIRSPNGTRGVAGRV